MTSAIETALLFSVLHELSPSLIIIGLCVERNGRPFPLSLSRMMDLRSIALCLAQKAVRGHKRALKLENYAQDCYLLLNSMGEDGDNRTSLVFVHSILPRTGLVSGKCSSDLLVAMFSSEMEAEALPNSKTVLAAPFE